MAEYYLVSQLPSLDGVGESDPLPIEEEYFLELCSRFLNPKTLRVIQSITLTPPLRAEKNNSRLVEAWNEEERSLRLALAKVRAEKNGKPFERFDRIPTEQSYRVSKAAVAIENPLDAERYLLSHRLSFLESLRPTDSFSEDYLYYYAIKLKLLLRFRRFDRALGEQTYQNIYNSVLDGIGLGAKQ